MLLGFENFQQLPMVIWDADFFRKIQDFSFWAVFNASKKERKKKSGYFEISECFYRDTSQGVVSKYIVLYGYKLFLSSYVGLKI